MPHLFCVGKHRISKKQERPGVLVFLLLRNKKIDLDGRGPRMAHMAEKIACGYFLLLRNKKLIFSAPVRGLAGWRKK